MAKASDMRQFSVPMRIEYQVHVTVEAVSAEEAEAKAKACEWVDDGLSGGDMCNWEVTGHARDEERS